MCVCVFAHRPADIVNSAPSLLPLSLMWTGEKVKCVREKQACLLSLRSRSSVYMELKRAIYHKETERMSVDEAALIMINATPVPPTAFIIPS